MEADIIQKSGAWYSHDDMRLGQGRENAKEFLKENVEVRDTIANSVREFLGLNQAVVEEKEAKKEKPAE